MVRSGVAAAAGPCHSGGRRRNGQRRRGDGGDCGYGRQSGIGAGIAAALAERGFAVACLTRSGRGPEGLDLPAYPVDVTDTAGLVRALDAAARDLGGLEGLVNNAGTHLQGPSADFPVADFARTMAVNTTAVFAAAQAPIRT